MYVKIEGERLNFLWYNQSTIRAEVYQGLADAINSSDGNIDGSQIGKEEILPSSFTGSARYQHQLYQDAMAIVCHFGKPDLFITCAIHDGKKLLMSSFHVKHLLIVQI